MSKQSHELIVSAVTHFIDEYSRSPEYVQVWKPKIQAVKFDAMSLLGFYIENDIDSYKARSANRRYTIIEASDLHNAIMAYETLSGLHMTSELEQSVIRKIDTSKPIYFIAEVRNPKSETQS